MKRRVSTTIAILFLSVFIWSSMLNQAQADSFTAIWAGYTFYGTDSFYGEKVVAYESGSNAVLYVSVTHNVTYSGQQLNVSAVGISLNWGDTFNSTQANRTNPVRLKWQESRIFTITFKVPSISNASNLFLWDYKIYMEHVNATGVVEGIETKTRLDFSPALPFFVIYSSEQTSSRSLATTIDGIKDSLGTPVGWNSSKAKMLWTKALNKTKAAENHYKLGEFSKAATNYEDALSLIDRAFTAEDAKGTSWEDAQIALLQAQVKWYEGWSNFYNGLSNMWTLIGVALVLFALGYIIRGLATLRKTSVPP